MPLPTPQSAFIETHVVQPGDTFSGISAAYDVPIENPVALKGLTSEEAIINIGQVLQIPLNITRSGPSVTLLSDSEVAYIPAYLDFDVVAAALFPAPSHSPW